MSNKNLKIKFQTDHVVINVGAQEADMNFEDLRSLLIKYYEGAKIL